MTKCLKCDKELPFNGTPYSLCYDPVFLNNMWGGDSHEYVGYFCSECAEKMKKKTTK